MQLNILGSGTPVPSDTRHGSSYVVRVGDDSLMFDCGPSTTGKLVQMGIRPTEIEHLVFTHHHYDHNVDYPCFLLSRWNETTERHWLNVIGPRCTEQLTHRLIDEDEGAFAPDWIARINHPLSLNAYTSRGGILPRTPPAVRATDITPGRVLDGTDWTITAAPAAHVEPWLDSLAYRLDHHEGSVVITGDTAPCDSVIELARGAATMVSLCTYIQAEIEGTPEAQFMCGSISVAKMAQEAGVGRLVITHQAAELDQPGNRERALRDILSVYEGEVVWGNELMTVQL